MVFLVCPGEFPRNVLSHSSVQVWKKRCRKRKAGATEPPRSIASQQERSAEAGKAEPFPPALSSPWADWPQDREQAPWLVAQHPPSLTYPSHCMGSRNQRDGDASICQCPGGLVPPGEEKRKIEFYPEVSAFGWHFSIFIEIHQRYFSIQKAKQFSSELKIEVFHLQRLTESILMFWSKINFELSCNKTLFGPGSCFKPVSSLLSHQSGHDYLSKHFRLFLWLMLFAQPMQSWPNYLQITSHHLSQEYKCT